MSIVARRVVVRGRVQGVGFRDGAVQAAAALGVSGWVRNRFDGSVESFVQGAAGDVDRFVAWCRRGPSAAKITGVVVDDAPPDAALDGFEWRPSA
ncbi:MAG: acylphosphatase [Burkholderiales bacterium]